jgi:homocysteine S-methyltransferase
MRNIIDRMKSTPLLFDGAMGTMIYSRGVFINACYDELCLTNPDLISQIHADYVAAGAEVVETNTFGADTIRLRQFGLAERCAEINRAGVRIARQAAGEGIYVAGSVGPCTNPNQLITDPQAALEVQAAYEEQISALAAEGVDIIMLETFTNLKELQIAAEVARASGVPVAASFSADDDGRTTSGTSVEIMAEALEHDDNVDAVGLNCGTGPAGYYELLRRILAHTSKPVIAMPNAGSPKAVGGRTLYLSNPEYFTEYCKRFVELGVRGIGGCCGTSPAHIREMARAVRSLPGGREHVVIRPASRPKASVNVVPPEQKCRFAARMLAGEKVTTVEILPPRAGTFDGMLEKCRACEAAGVDAINIPDGPRASARLSPMITALTILRETGIEPILHYCCRDRNLIGMQSDLLGAHAAGLRNFLIITGDPPKLGNYPDATGVFDVDSIGLTQVVSNLNRGVDAGGNEIDPATGIFIGVGANPVAVEPKREMERFVAKIHAGAEYAITQPVFDADALLRFVDEAGELVELVPIVAGIWPLLSFKNAEFMNNEVPGVVVPEAVLDRMAACHTKEEARQAGIDIAREIRDRVAGRVSGFQVSAPLGIVDIALKVLA